MTPIEALEAIHRLLEQRDTISLTAHVRIRMRQRNFTMDDIRRVLLKGIVSPHAEWDETSCNWKYKISGRDYDNQPLALVVVIEPSIYRITVITGTDD